MPPELIVLLIAMIPVADLKASIPLAMLVFGMTWYEAFFWSVAGNALTVVIVYAAGDYWMRSVERRRGPLHRFTDYIVRKTRHFFRRRYDKYGLLALPIFVAIPAPVAGAWTCAIAAFIYKVPFKKAFPLILLGIELGAVLVILAVEGVLAAIKISA